MTWGLSAVATERATEGGQQENPLPAAAVIPSPAAPRCLSVPTPRGAVWPGPAARWLPAPRRAHFASDYSTAVAPAVPASLS